MDLRRLGVMTAGMINFLNLYNVQALLPTLSAEFAVSLPQVGLIITSSLIAVAAVAPFVGSASDMIGRKWLISGAIWLLTIPTLLAAQASGLQELILWRFVQGLLLPFIFSITIAYIGEETTGAENIRLVGAYSVGTIVGGFGGRLIAGYIASVAGWRASFHVFAFLTVAAAAIVTWTLPREQNFRPVRGWRGTIEGFYDHLTNRELIATYAIGFGVLFSIVAAFSYSNFVLAAAPYSLGPAQLGAVFVVYLVGLIATAASTRLVLRFGRRVTLVIATATELAGLAITLIPNLWAIIGGLALIASGGFVQGALATGYIGLAAKRSKSIAVGLYVTCYYIGGSAGGVLPAAAWHVAGWAGCVALIAIIQAGMLAIALTYWREPRPT